MRATVAYLPLLHADILLNSAMVQIVAVAFPDDGALPASSLAFGEILPAIEDGAFGVVFDEAGKALSGLCLPDRRKSA